MAEPSAIMVKKPMSFRIASSGSAKKTRTQRMILGQMLAAGVLWSACAHTPDAELQAAGIVDAQALSTMLRCPRGTIFTRGQTLGVQTAVWCERPGGVKHGPFVEWYENHQKKSAGEYADGHRQGRWSFFLLNGQLESRITYEKSAVVSTEAGTAAAIGPAAPSVAPAAPPAAAPHSP